MTHDNQPGSGLAHETIEVLSETADSVFTSWRRLLSGSFSEAQRLAGALSSRAHNWVAQWPRVGAYHAASPEPWTDDGALARQAAAAVGVRAFLSGLLIAGVVTTLLGGGARSALMTALTELLWTAARFAIIGMLAPPKSIDRGRLAVAFMAGLTPYIFGATALLRLASLLASAVLTGRGLKGAGMPKRDINIAVGWAFGGQVGVIAAGWLARGVFALIGMA